MDKLPKGFEIVKDSDPSLPEGFSLLEEDEQGSLSAAGEVALSMASGGLGEIVGGLFGLATGDVGAINSVADAFTYEPRGKKGKQYAEKTGKFIEEKVRQPMIKQAIETSQALPFDLDSNQRELLGTIGTDTFLNFLPLDLGLRGARSVKLPKAKEADLTKAKKLDSLTKQEPQAVPEGFNLLQEELDLFSPDQKQLGVSPYDAVGGKFTVDENGIPIKQMLSEEASRAADGDQSRLFEDPTQPVDPVIAKRMQEEQAAQAQLADEQLKKQEIEDAYQQRADQQRQMTIDEQLARRDEILMKVQEDFGLERVSKGQQRKANARRVPRGQRGAIDAEAVKEMTNFFKRGMASARDLLDTWKGAFTENELGVARKAIDNPKSLDTVVFMKPEEFHDLASKRTPAELNASYTPRLHDSIKEGLKSKGGLWEMPYLRVDNEGRVIAHEGRHRMDVFTEQGYDLVPVRLRKASGEGWGTWQAPSKIIPQDFKDSPPAIKELAKRDFPEVIHAKQTVQLPKSQRGAIDLSFLDAQAKKGKESLEKLREVAWTKFWESNRDYNGPEYKDVKIINDKLFELEKQERSTKGLNTNTLKEISPGYTNIQSGTKVLAKHGIKYQEPTRGTVVGHKDMRFEDGPYQLAVVDFGDGMPRTILPGDILQVFSGPKNQRGGLDLKAIGEGVKKLVDSVVPKTPKIVDKPVITPQEKALNSIPGMKEATNDYIPPDPTAAEILESSLGNGDSNLTMRGVQSGATLTGIKYDSSLIQGIGRLYQNAQKRSEKAISDFIYPVEYAFKALNKKEITELADVMKLEMFDGRLITADKLREAGYTPKQIDAYTKMRDMFNRVYDQQAQALQAQNKKVPTKREAYLSSRWNGDWHVPVYTKDGKLIYYIAEKTKSQAYNALEYLKDKADIDLTRSKVEYKEGFSKRGSTYDAYQTMLSLVDKNDPRAAAVKSIMKDAIANDAYNSIGQKKHFENKANIRGFLGDKPWLDSKTNAYDLFKSQFDYAKNALTWTELQKATDVSKEVLANDYLVQEQPNNLRYAQEYAKNKLGFGDSNWVNQMENTANKMLGTSKQSFYSVVGDMKSFFILSKLGFNLGFMTANIIQPVFTLPWHGNLVSMGIKHNPFQTFIKGGLDSVSGYGKYSLGLDLPMTELGKDALKYAEDNGVVKRSMFDETANIGRHPIIEGAEKVASKSIQTIEHLARLNSFMGFVHHLDQSGMYKDLNKMFQKAEELTNAAMVDYRPGEGPMVFDSMGVAGEALKTLQTFKFNYYNQLHYFLKEATEGRPNALVTFIALQGMLGGAIGLPLLQEIDDIWETIRDHLPNDLHIKVKDFGIKKKMIEEMPDWASYGGLSKLTGINFSSRFDSGNLADMSLDSLFPFIKDITNQASKVYNLAKEPGESTKAEAAYALAPPGPIQGLVETKMDAFKGPKTQEGNQVYLNPKDLRKQDANFVRTPEQEAKRSFGFTDLEEAKYKGLRYTQNKMDRVSEERRNEIAERFLDAVIYKDTKRIDKYVYQYMKYEGNPQQLIDRLDNDLMRRRLPAETLQAMRAQTLSAVQKAKRMKELLGGFNN